MAGEHISQENPNHQTGWDSTSLSTFKRCPREYQLSILGGWRPKSESVHLVFGAHYHKLLENYDKYRIQQHVDHVTATRQVVRDWAKLTQDWVSEDPKKNRETLLRTVLWYLEEFENDAIKTHVLLDGRPAVEVSFRYECGEYSGLTGEPYIFCGHFDRVVRMPTGQLYIADRKTTKSTISPYYFDRYQLDNQMSFYTMAGTIVLAEQVGGVIIDAAQIMNDFTKFARGFVQRTPSQVNEWFDDTVYYLRQAEKMAKNGYWPMNDTACNNFGGCRYKQICGRDRIVRDAILKTSFHQEFWNPLEPRGDE